MGGGEAEQRSAMEILKSALVSYCFQYCVYETRRKSRQIVEILMNLTICRSRAARDPGSIAKHRCYRLPTPTILLLMRFVLSIIFPGFAEQYHHGSF